MLSQQELQGMMIKYFFAKICIIIQLWSFVYSFRLQPLLVATLQLIVLPSLVQQVAANLHIAIKEEIKLD
jgi:hypothetical protein